MTCLSCGYSRKAYPVFQPIINFQSAFLMQEVYCQECEVEFARPGEEFCSDECADRWWDSYANHQYDDVDFGEDGE